jgi:uncharacterized repeat protein (TIGR01451 family)
MFRRIAISTTVFVMLAQLFLQATPALAWTTYCDAAAFVADVTVPDGTDFAPNAAFTKTWRLKNVGTCTWTTSYSLTWVSGDPMSAVYPVALTANVAPGGSVDVSANMVAPASNGTYQGFWELKNASGQLFGIGSTASSPFWVLIDVATAATVGLDFVSTMCSATWSSGAGSLGCPGTDGNASGFELQITSPQLENGTTDSAPGLLTNPQAVSNGYIMGVYPDYLVKSGDHFQSIVNCQYGATTCNVYFQLQYQVGSGPITTYWQFHERYEGLYYRANLDLSPLAGQTVKFILRAQAYGGSTNNRALWGSPRIATFSSGGGTPPPTSPPSTPPPSTPPPSGCTDKASFIADITVPDYTVFAPNTAFTKTWRLKNTGTCTWTTSYKLTWVSGNAMSAVYPVAFTTTVSPGATVDLSANMVSPAANGTYQGNWMLQNASGTTFGIGSSGTSQFWVLIRVSGGVTATPPPASCDRASFVADVTVPDYTVFAPSTAFVKTWRLKNVGTCTWTTSYKLVFVSGSQMSAPATVAFPTTVAPGATVDLSANMVAPIAAGTYQGNWMLQNASGVNFGIGSSGTGVFWVLIQVSGVAPTPGPSPTVGPSPTPAPAADLYVTISDGTSTYTPGDFVYYTVVVGNNGLNNVTGALFSLTAPIQSTNSGVSCVPDGGASCTAGPTSVAGGAVYTDVVTIPVGGHATYSQAVYIPHDVLSTITNFASVAVPAGYTDPSLGNNNASDSDTAAPKADVQLTGVESIPNYVPGGTITYTYTVTNTGPSNAVGAIFNASVSSQVTSWTVTCVPTPGATCTGFYALSGGATSYGDTVTIPPGFILTITIVSQIDLAATGSVTNTASISAPAGTTDPNPGNNTLTFSNNP